MLSVVVRLANRLEETPMAKNQTRIRIFCFDGEPIVLKRLDGTISLHTDSERYELSDKEAGSMGEWLVFWINQPPGSRSISPRPPKRHEATVWDLIQAGLLKPGTVLTMTYIGTPHNAKVLPEGELEFYGRIFDTPSGACEFVTGTEINGWKAWKTPERTLDELRKDLLRSRIRNKYVYFCVDGEPIVLKRLDGTVSLHTDSERYELSDKEAGCMGEWLVSQIGQPSGSGSTRSKPRNGRKKPCRYEGTVWGLMRAGLLKPGTVLTMTYAGKEHKAKVLPEGELEVYGQIFNTPSGACEFVLGRSCNGWTAWKTPERPLDDLRQEL